MALSKTIISCIICLFLFSCTSTKKKSLNKSFDNSEVLSINIVKIEHPLLGGIINIDTLNIDQQKAFLKKLDNLEYRGLYKCASQYIIRINLENDTIRFKLCGNMISDRNSDHYFALPDDEPIIDISNYD